MKHDLIVPSNGNNGGITLLWKEDVKVEIAKRPKSWAKLKHLKGTSPLPWLAIEDFNEITSLLEKEGGSLRPRKQMELFVNAIDTCGLRDIGFIGPKYTWLYQRSGGVRERLDRALGTTDWLALFPEAKLYHLSTSISDHSALSLYLIPKKKKSKGRKMFIFESIWLKDNRCEENVKTAWEDGVLSGSNWVLGTCFEHCKSSLDAWNKLEFGHVGKTIAALQTKLEWLELQPSSP
ncbi:uncharacterized protein LOC142623107 [Castanea sativa]|uniref:uncharacterized protein LOC142623107 n=1 Tax=Castanea sativa TaxID=21020 RepID=UPI003F6531E2